MSEEEKNIKPMINDEVIALKKQLAILQTADVKRQVAENALIHSQLQQKAILDSIPDMAWLKDKESCWRKKYSLATLSLMNKGQFFI